MKAFAIYISLNFNSYMDALLTIRLRCGISPLTNLINQTGLLLTQFNQQRYSWRHTLKV